MIDPFEHAQRVRSKLAELAAQVERPMAFAACKGQSRIVVSRDPSKPGRWRATSLDADGPVGHTEAQDFAGALRAAYERGADIFAPPS